MAALARFGTRLATHRTGPDHEAELAIPAHLANVPILGLWLWWLLLGLGETILCWLAYRRRAVPS